MFLHHPLLDNEMNQLLIGSVMGSMSSVWQQPLGASGNIFVLLTNMVLLVMFTRSLHYDTTGDG